MLRTNLSTRPFYNARGVHTVLVIVAAIVVAITLFNVAEYIRLSTRERSLGGDAAQAEREAARLHDEAARLRSQIDSKDLDVVARAAREANAIIDQRAFSWTTLFSAFEQTLPSDVRITAVQPRVERDGRLVVSIQAEAKRVDDLDVFIEALEAQGTFHNVLPAQEQPREDGLVDAVISAEYTRQPRSVVPASGAGR
jgi:hypothetical protein